MEERPPNTQHTTTTNSVPDYEDADHLHMRSPQNLHHLETQVQYLTFENKLLCLSTELSVFKLWQVFFTSYHISPFRSFITSRESAFELVLMKYCVLCKKLGSSTWVLCMELLNLWISVKHFIVTGMVAKRWVSNWRHKELSWCHCNFTLSSQSLARSHATWVWQLCDTGTFLFSQLVQAAHHRTPPQWLANIVTTADQGLTQQHRDLPRKYDKLHCHVAMIICLGKLICMGLSEARTGDLWNTSPKAWLLGYSRHSYFSPISEEI